MLSYLKASVTVHLPGSCKQVWGEIKQGTVPLPQLEAGNKLPGRLGEVLQASLLKLSDTLVMLLLVLGLLTACSTADEAASSTANQADGAKTENPSTVVETTISAPVSPIETPEEVFESPIPTPVPYRGPDFEINDPVRAGDTTVTGTGPSGITIEIVDVSLGGQVKGTGIISEDGTFSIEATPIEGGHVIGVMLVDLGNSQYTAADFRDNENYMDIPMIGFLATTYEVPLN